MRRSRVELCEEAVKCRLTPPWFVIGYKGHLVVPGTFLEVSFPVGQAVAVLQVLPSAAPGGFSTCLPRRDTRPCLVSASHVVAMLTQRPTFNSRLVITHG